MVRNGMVKGLIIKIVKKMKTYIYILKYIYLFNKTRHSYIYIYVVYSHPNGWTDWTEIFCGHSCLGGGIIGYKNSKLSVQFFLFHGQRRALQLVNILIYKIFERDRNIFQ